MKMKKIASLILAGCMMMVGSAPAFAAQGLKEVHIMTVQERAAIAPLSTVTGRVLLPKTVAGKTGNPCAQFVADASHVSFTITTAATASTYNVQLYQGTIADGGSLVSSYNTLDVGVGVSISDLEIGQSYYFVVSSLDAPAKGSNATYERITF